ncbi:MAG: hypothetical protein R3E72_05425 [Steroidobacteraceae bacterium]
MRRSWPWPVTHPNYSIGTRTSTKKYSTAAACRCDTRRSHGCGSTAHGCAFCNKGNRLDAERAGLTLAHIEAIERPLDPIWTAAERALLQLAGQMLLTNPTGFLSPELYADLRPHFDDAQLFELGMTLAVLAGMAKFLFVYDLVEKEPYCQIGKPVG